MLLVVFVCKQLKTFNKKRSSAKHLVRLWLQVTYPVVCVSYDEGMQKQCICFFERDTPCKMA